MEALSIRPPKSMYGGFSLDNIQVFYDYIHGQEMIRVEAGVQLRQAVEAVPIEPASLINAQQQAGLHDWLYDFLVAFSRSGSDDLAANFYLREGVNNSEGVEQLRRFTKSRISLADDTPFDLFKEAHRLLLSAELDRDYLFSHVSFFDSVFKVFEMQTEYASYQAYAETRGMVPRGATILTFALRKEVEEHLQAGQQIIFVDIMFIVEEPAEFTTFRVPGRTPSFFRLVWDSERSMWRHLEAFFSYGVPQAFLFSVM